MLKFRQLGATGGGVHLQRPLRHEEVGGFDVAMADATAVAGGHHLEHLEQHHRRLMLRQLPVQLRAEKSTR